MEEDNRVFIRSHEMLSRHDSRLLVVDVQEKLLPHISVAEQVIENCRRMILGAGILGVPVYGTEQYPKGLGPTTPRLTELLGEMPEKLRFSCAEVLNWGMAGDLEEDRHKVVVVGIEAHVCVQQTVLDLLSHGFQVYLPADGVASRHKFDWKIALERMATSGATVTTCESVLFEWAEVAGTAEFKQISKLVTGR